MPPDGITLPRGRSTAERRAIAYGGHEPPVETCSVLRYDRFQITEQREAGEMIYISANDKPDWSFGNGVASYVAVAP